MQSENDISITEHKTKSGKRRTKTSNFGSPGRSSHDSTGFYSSKLYEGISNSKNQDYSESPVPDGIINKIMCKSSESMDELPDSSVHLVVTSPPYNTGKVYEEELTLNEYRSFIKRVMAEVYRVLVPGGRICFNIANLGRKPYIPLDSYITEDLLSLGLLMRGQIIWDKASSSGVSTAWGSWNSAANPTLRDIHEYILVFSKDSLSRPKLQGRNSTITKEDFLELTKSIWRFQSESAKQIGHPAPFPVELARRCIELYTYSDEVILDPFMGSGTTAIAAMDSKRRFVGYETNAEYIDLFKSRLMRRSNSVRQT